MELAAAHLEVIERQHLGEVRGADSIPALDETLRNPSFGLGIAVSTGAHDRADVVIGELHDLLGRPIGIIRKAVGERRYRGVRLPFLGIERFVVETPDGSKLRVFRTLPSRRVDSHPGNVLEGSIEVEGLIVAAERLLRLGAAATERGVKIDKVATNDGHVVTDHEGVEGVDSADAIVIEP